MMSYLCKIGRFADAVDTTKSDDVRTLVLLSLHCVTQDINAAFRSQNLDTSLLQGVANGRCHGWEINKRLNYKNKSIFTESKNNRPVGPELL